MSGEKNSTVVVCKTLQKSQPDKIVSASQTNPIFETQLALAHAFNAAETLYTQLHLTGDTIDQHIDTLDEQSGKLQVYLQKANKKRKSSQWEFQLNSRLPTEPCVRDRTRLLKPDVSIY